MKRPLRDVGLSCSVQDRSEDIGSTLAHGSATCVYCSRCRKRRGSPLWLMGVVGLRLLSSAMCPCHAFSGYSAGRPLSTHRRKPDVTGHQRFIDEAAFPLGDETISWRNGGMLQPDGADFAMHRSRTRGRRRQRPRVPDSDTALAIRSPNRKDGSSLLYDSNLLIGGVALAESRPRRSCEIQGGGVNNPQNTLEVNRPGEASSSNSQVNGASEAAQRTQRADAPGSNTIPQFSPSERPQPSEPRLNNQTTLNGATSLPRRDWSGRGRIIGSERCKTEVELRGARAPTKIGNGTSTPSPKRTISMSESTAINDVSVKDVDLDESVDNTRQSSAPPVIEDSVDSTEPHERRSWRTWGGIEGRAGQDRGVELEPVNGTPREELTVYLLDGGATHYDVSLATAALAAAEPDLALTTTAWHRWKRNLDGLKSSGFSGSDVANMLVLCPQLLALDFEGQVIPAMEVLRSRLKMRPTDVRRVVRKAPEVLAPRADGSTSAEAVDVLCMLGLKTRYLRTEALRWPELLTIPSAQFFQLAAFLASEEIGMKAAEVGSLIRQAPWLVQQRIDGQMLPVVRFLRRQGVSDVERVIRAYPRILSSDVGIELKPRVTFLLEDVGISEEDLPRVLQTFPLLFAVPLARMRDVVTFLADDLTINEKDVAKIIRAFPSLLGLERDRHMVGVVHYLKTLGVQNVGRFVSRLPPVLGYDVTTNLVPKMNYLVESMGLSVYDVLTFPAYFSYPLDTVIEPRSEFLNVRRRPITLVGLNIALQSGDGDFARRVAKVRPEMYGDFKAAYIANRESVRRGESTVESLLTDQQRLMIGNMGGLSASPNTEDVSRRATGLPPQNMTLPEEK